MDITLAMLKDWTERIEYGTGLLKQFPNGTTLEDLYGFLSGPGEWSGFLRVALFAINLDAAEELVANGVDVSVRTPQGVTPLLIAAGAGDAALAQWLIAHGAALSVDAGLLNSALHEAVWCNKRSVGDVLMAHGVRPDLFVAAGFGMTEKLGELLKTQSPDAELAVTLTTPLQVAAHCGQGEAARMLLDAGADVNARSDHGLTALHEAASNGHVETARMLLGAGAEVDAAEETQSTPLHLAAERGDEAMARLLLDAQADPNARNFSGGTPLHVAMFFGNVRVAEMLVDAGADPAARDDQGETPLDKAAEYSNDPPCDAR